MTFIATPCALATLLLSVIAGRPAFEKQWSTMAGKVPSCVGVHPLRKFKVESVKAALTLLSAACGVVGLVKPEMVKVMCSPEGNEPALR